MSIIQNIRDKAAWIIIGAIALALIAFVVQDGFRSKSLFSGSDNSVGVINGNKVDAIEFQQRINAAEEQYRAAGYPLNDMMRQNIRESLWNEYVENSIMTDHYDELGIGVSDKELSDILYGQNPPQDLRQQFTDPKTGQYDANAAYQQIQALRKQKTSPMYASFFNQYLPALVKSRQKEKYISLISNSTYVPKWMVERVNSDASQQASISYVSIPYITISDSSIKVSDAEINDYVGKHKDEFKQERSRSIEYVTFDAAPSKADTNQVVQQLLAVKDEFATTTDPESFLTRNASETPYYNGYIAKSKIQVPNADSILALSDGQVFGPYIDNNNFVLAKMIGKRSIPDSVKVRHILVKTSPSAQGLPGLADSIAKPRIDSIAAAIQRGANFDSMVVKYSDDEGSTQNKGVYEFSSLQFSTISKEFAEAAFYGKVGDKKVVHVSNSKYAGYHYIEVLSQRNFEPAFQVAYLSKPILASDETMNAAMGLASQMAAEARSRAEFDAIAKKKNINKFTAAEIKPLETNISGLGSSRELVKWMFDAKVGDVSERPFLVGDKYVVPALIAAYEEGLVPAELARSTVEPIVRNEKKASQITGKIAKGATLDAIGQTFNQPVAASDSILFSSPFVPNVGQEHKVVGASFAKVNLNKVSEPIAGNSGVFVIRTNKVGAVANPSFDAVQQQASMQEFQQRTFSDPRVILDILKKNVKIKDNRYKFF